MCVDSPTVWPCLFFFFSFFFSWQSWIYIRMHSRGQWFKTVIMFLYLNMLHLCLTLALMFPLTGKLGCCWQAGDQGHTSTVEPGLGVSVRPAGYWHAILILQLHFSSFLSNDLWGQIIFLPCDWQRSILSMTNFQQPPLCVCSQFFVFLYEARTTVIQNKMIFLLELSR